MGCGASKGSSVEVFTDPLFVDINKAWDLAWKTVETKKIGNMEKKLIVRRRGWKTIRIFVSSTFRDFHQEREVLVKKVRFLFLLFELSNKLFKNVSIIVYQHIIKFNQHDTCDFKFTRAKK